MSTTTLPTDPQPVQRRRPGSPLWAMIAVGLALAILLAEYLILRFVSSPVLPVFSVVSALLLVLAISGFLGSRRGHATPFLAVALILPYLIVGVAVLGTYQRVEDQVGTWLDDLSGAPSDTGSLGTTDNGDGTTPDSSDEVHNESGALVTEDYAGVNCNSLSPQLGTFHDCVANGGMDDVGSGSVEGDQGYVDKNADSVDDHFYDGQDCRATPLGDLMGSQQEFAECDANGGKRP